MLPNTGQVLTGSSGHCSQDPTDSFNPLHQPYQAGNIIILICFYFLQTALLRYDLHPIIHRFLVCDIIINFVKLW